MVTRGEGEREDEERKYCAGGQTAEPEGLALPFGEGARYGHAPGSRFSNVNSGDAEWS